MQIGPFERPRLACLISGGGTTVLNLQASILAEELDADIVSVIASNNKCQGIQRCVEMGLETTTILRKSFANTAEFSKAIFNSLRQSEVDLVCLCGFLSLLKIPEDFIGRVINIHPSLLPSFGGLGMHGNNVHHAVINHGARVSGCTVHLCDNTYDTGPIILQRGCEVYWDDDATSLAERVFQQECIAYPQALEILMSGQLTLENSKLTMQVLEAGTDD